MCVPYHLSLFTNSNNCALDSSKGSKSPFVDSTQLMSINTFSLMFVKPVMLKEMVLLDSIKTVLSKHMIAKSLTVNEHQTVFKTVFTVCASDSRSVQGKKSLEESTAALRFVDRRHLETWLTFSFNNCSSNSKNAPKRFPPITSSQDYYTSFGFAQGNTTVEKATTSHTWSSQFLRNPSEFNFKNIASKHRKIEAFNIAMTQTSAIKFVPTAAMRSFMDSATNGI
ncbi:hypothetical protein BDR26DRAFT_878849 [Obelidium mucronatum]|nr:hypothetical protein BDR26DRAFT_878849 [Obelidium mucronatum]